MPAGDAGLHAVAERVGMEDFEVSTSWGWARISAADMTLLFASLDRVLPDAHAAFGKGLWARSCRTRAGGSPRLRAGARGPEPSMAAGVEAIEGVTRRLLGS